MTSKKTSENHSTKPDVPNCKPGEGQALEPTIIAEQHRAANIGPKTISTDTQFPAPSSEEPKKTSKSR